MASSAKTSGMSDALEEAGGELARGVGEEGYAVLFQLVAGAGEAAGLVEGVGIGEEQQLAAWRPARRPSRRCSCL